MKRLIILILSIFTFALAGCQAEPGPVTKAPDTTPPATEDTAAEGTTADYPAAIMVDDVIYLLNEKPMAEAVDESSVIGYTKSYTDTFPEKNEETNFNRELDMPYAKVEDGIAVLYEEEWQLCTPQE